MEDLKLLLDSNKFIELKNALVEQNVVDIAEFLEELNTEKLLLVFRILPKDICADVFSYITKEQRQQIIMSISDKEAGQIIDNLYLDDAVDFLEEVPSGVVRKILQNVDENTRKLINTFLQYPQNSAGSIMTVEYVELHAEYTVKDAIETIRRTGLDKETVYTCYVISKDRVLLGTVALRTLILCDDNTLVTEIMNTKVISVNTHDDQEIVADYLGTYDFLSLPVVDNEGRLVGIITVDDAIDVIEDENTEDFEKMAAIMPSETEYLKTPVLSMAKNRIVWLFLLMISATFTGAIISKFENVLGAVMVLTSFIPMLTDTGGNAGAQASTMVIRGLALNEIEVKDVFKVVWKEVRVSFLCGAMLAGVNFLRLIIINRASFTLALVVSLSLIITVMLAKIIGGALPIGAKILKLDPALMASPLITTIVDALALIVYFQIAMWLLNI